MLGLFTTKDDTKELEKAKEVLLDTVNQNFDMHYKLQRSKILNDLLLSIGLTYIVDPYSKELIWINEELKNEFGEVEGKKCHEVLQNNKTVCPFCPYGFLKKHPNQIFKWFHKNHVNGKIYMIFDIFLPEGFNGHKSPLQLEKAFEITNADYQKIKSLMEE